MAINNFTFIIKQVKLKFVEEVECIMKEGAPIEVG